MAGTAKTSQVLLSTATVMLGPMADVNILTPERHSIGLVKNVTYTSEPEFRELTQGLTNDVVMSVKVGDGSRVSMEVYEYTARNLAYAAGLDATGVEYDTSATLYTTSAAPTGTSVTVSGTPTGISAGDYIYIQGGNDDLVHIGKVASIATSTITLAAGFAIPAGMTFPAASRVRKVRTLNIGAATPSVTLACKITGIIDPSQNTPVSLVFPKVKVTRGMNLAFSTENYGNMPFEFTPYSLVSTDTAYAEYNTTKMRMYVA